MKKTGKETKPGHDDLAAFDELEGEDIFEEIKEEPQPASGAGISPDDELPFSDPPEDTVAKPAGRAKAAVAAGVGDPAATAPRRHEDSLVDEFATLAPDVPVNLIAVIGKSTTSIGDLIRYRIGHVVDLGRPPGESVDLVANGRLIARGELVEMDGKLGVRILKMVR